MASKLRCYIGIEDCKPIEPLTNHLTGLHPGRPSAANPDLQSHQLWLLPAYNPKGDIYHVDCSDEDAAVYSSLLKKCCGLKSLPHGSRVHALILTSGHIGNTFLGNLLVQMYGSCGAMAEATFMFASLPKRNVYSWNLLIGAYVQNKYDFHVIFSLYQHMQHEGVTPDKVTFVSTLSAFSGAWHLLQGEWMHVYMESHGFTSDPIAGTALLNMYGNCGTPEDAWRVFDQIMDKNTITWNAMFAVYTQHGQHKKALMLFQRMEMTGVFPSKVTFITLLPACTSQEDITEGKRIHTRILHEAFESDVKLDNTLLDMYGKCSALDLACFVFTAMPDRDVISWNIMSEAYIQQGQNEMAFYLFLQMLEEGTIFDEISCVSVISACVNETSLLEGKRIHSRLINHDKAMADVVVGTALVNMYAKCGHLGGGWETFSEMPVKNVVSWNVMMGAYGQHGLMDKCLYIFQEMLSRCVVPTEYSYFGVLFSYSHTGILDEAYFWFGFMVHYHGITPSAEHFNCMIDLLGRAGQLDEAEAVLCAMSCPPSAASWAALLGSCKLHLDVDRGIRIIERVIRNNPESAVPYVSLSNIHAAVDRWDEAEKLQQEWRGPRKQQHLVFDYEFWEEEY